MPHRKISTWLYLINNKVDKTFFRVHSYFFTRESDFWKEELGDDLDKPLKKGQDVRNPVVLDETPDDFAWFLWVFYNRYVLTSSEKSEGKIIRPTSSFGNHTKASEQDWKTILRMAAKWGFDQVRELAVRHLANADMDLVNRIKLYKEHEVAQKHIFPLYVQLVERQELIGLDEAQILGMETLVMIHSVRERIRAPVTEEQPLLSPIRKDVKPKDITDIVASTFNVPRTNGQTLSPLTR